MHMVLLVSAGACVPQCAHGGKGMAFGCWFLLSTCLRQKVLFAAVYIRLAGLTVLEDSPVFASHLPVISDFYLIITPASHLAVKNRGYRPVFHILTTLSV